MVSPNRRRIWHDAFVSLSKSFRDILMKMRPNFVGTNYIVCDGIGKLCFLICHKKRKQETKIEDEIT